MDDLVRAAMAKWPHVPDCYGWLGLDARGRWWMRDERTQQAGPFAGAGATPMSRGTELRNDRLQSFINRNYGADALGRWYFQNGPQRVYVELERSPWVWRLGQEGGLMAHTGLQASYAGAYVDEVGYLYVLTELGCGIVHSQDMHLAAERIALGVWQVQAASFADLQVIGQFVLSPIRMQGRPG